MSIKLNKHFYQGTDTKKIARQMLGKFLCTNINGAITSGIITETEAYEGINDKACHAYNNRYTQRTKTMYSEGGVAYVYLCYGIHHLFNVVTNKANQPHAVLIRAIYPYDGIYVIEKRRNQKNNLNIANGPGKVTMSLGINDSHNNVNLNGDTIWIEDRKLIIDASQILVTSRIGIDYAEEDVNRLNRFVLTQKF